MRHSLWSFANALLLIFLPLPLLIVMASSISPSRYFVFPPTGFSLIWYDQFFSSPQWLLALGVSLLIAVVASLASTVAAVMTALGVERLSGRMRGVIDTIILSPLIFPQASTGVALLGFITSTHYLRGTYLGIAFAHTILCVPFAYRPIAASFSKLDRSLAEAAMNLGATEAMILRRIALPQIWPGVVTALLFAFIISFDEITVTLFLAAPGITTLPLHIYLRLEESADPVVAAVSTLLVLLTFGLVLLLQRTVGLNLFVSMDTSEDARVEAT